jgi:hypothetical protein
VSVNNQVLLVVVFFLAQILSLLVKFGWINLKFRTVALVEIFNS